MLNIYEIYPAVSGEVSFLHQGRLCTIIRFAGCNLRPGCAYCDAVPAQVTKGIPMSISDVVEEVHKLGNSNILITGGEPLLQAEGLYELLLALEEEPCPPEYQIAIETNGSVMIPDNIMNMADGGFIAFVVDYKLPSSGQQESMREWIFRHQLHSDDWVKFVIQTKEDYNFAIEKKRELREKYYSSANFAFSIALDENNSPATPGLDHKWLLKKLQEDKQFDSVINLQIHKIIGSP